ncbi:Sortilin-related receptor, partial [Halocaridina rubra]
MTTPEPLTPFEPLHPPSSGNCTALMFRCDNSHCIPFWWRCDALDDCGDASDEAGCVRPGIRTNTTVAPPSTPPVHTCKWDQFQCSDGSCIWETWICDNDKDCPEGEDEENCHQKISCSEKTEFRCRRSGGCISSRQLCDGQKDCADGSDEEGCESVSTPISDCPVGYFSCDGGACQESFKLCNNNHDCVDLSDEQHCSATFDKAYSVTDFTVTKKSNVTATLTWKVNSGSTIPDNIEFLPSLILKAAVGNPNAWKNYTWTQDV